jgi:hypothetical protein
MVRLYLPVIIFLGRELGILRTRATMEPRHRSYPSGPICAYLRRITVAEKVYAKKPAEILPSLIDIAWLYMKQGRVTDAETYNRHWPSSLS